MFTWEWVNSLYLSMCCKITKAHIWIWLKNNKEWKGQYWRTSNLRVPLIRYNLVAIKRNDPIYCKPYSSKIHLNNTSSYLQNLYPLLCLYNLCYNIFKKMSKNFFLSKHFYEISTKQKFALTFSTKLEREPCY